MAIAGLLLDIEGVLLQEGRAIGGAAEALAGARARGLGLRYLTNTTTRPRAEIAARLRAEGIAAEPSEVLSPATAAAARLSAEGVRRLHLAAAPALAEDFPGFELVDARPEAVVLGDLHTGFDWARLDGLFAMLREGARLVALHRNRYCRRGGRIALDLGPFVAALEYAAGIEAEVVGKPAPAFFAAALASLGLPAGAVAMVGDDIEADIGGALAAGLVAVQVRTGKFTARDEAADRPQPAARISSVAGLGRWLDAQG